MRNNIFALATGLFLALPSLALAQGVVGGADAGSREGNRTAGPVRAVVGGVVGAVGGGIAGLLGADQRPRFREYVVREHHDSYAYDRPVVVGTELPGAGVTYYDVPAEYGAGAYRYTIINGQAVLVDPATGRIVEVLE